MRLTESEGHVLRTLQVSARNLAEASTKLNEQMVQLLEKIGLSEESPGGRHDTIQEGTASNPGRDVMKKIMAEKRAKGR